MPTLQYGFGFQTWYCDCILRGNKIQVNLNLHFPIWMVASCLGDSAQTICHLIHMCSWVSRMFMWTQLCTFKSSIERMNSWPHSKLVLPFWLLYQSSWWQYKLTFLRSPLFDLFMKMRYHPKCKQFSVSIWFWIFEEISVKPEHCAGKDSSNSDLSLLLLIIFYCF